jgi:hypothetical protein
MTTLPVNISSLYSDLVLVKSWLEESKGATGVDVSVSKPLSEDVLLSLADWGEIFHNICITLPVPILVDLVPRSMTE